MCEETTQPAPEPPVVLNPEVVGDLSQTPLVYVSGGVRAWLERTRCPECRLVNHCHKPDCTVGGSDV